MIVKYERFRPICTHSLICRYCHFMKSCITLDIDRGTHFFHVTDLNMDDCFHWHYKQPSHLVSHGPVAPPLFWVPLWVVANSEERPWSTASGGSTHRRMLHTTRENSSPQAKMQQGNRGANLIPDWWEMQTFSSHEAITLLVEFDAWLWIVVTMYQKNLFWLVFFLQHWSLFREGSRIFKDILYTS